MKQSNIIESIKQYKISSNMMYIISAFIGLTLFLIIYGPAVIDVTYDAWLYNCGEDISQHYIGWLYYRKSSWSFPIGLLDGITSPYRFSVIFMDSIPILAFIFKLLSPILPATFQYFGLYGVITFMLQGYMGAKIIYSKTEDEKSGLIGAMYFLTASVLYRRMFIHSALAFHPIILMSLYMFMNRKKINNTRKDFFLWSGLLVLAVSVHAYFFPMVLAFMIAYYLPDILTKKPWIVIIKIIVALILTVSVMYIWGYFYGNHDFNGGGFGTYNANLNTLINGQQTSFFAGLAGIRETDINGEAYGYLGFGMIILVIAAAIALFVEHKQERKGVNKKEILSICILIIVFLFVATFPVIRLGKYVLIDIHLPKIIENLCGTFRANGRFIWPIMYFVFAYAIICVFKYSKHRYLILILCLIIQVLDLTPLYRLSANYVDNMERMTTSLENTAWNELTGKKEIYFMYDPIGNGDMHSTMALGKYAVDNDMVMNDFYTARKDSSLILKQREQEKKKLCEGKADANKIYIFDQLPIEYLSGRTGLKIYYIDNIILGVTDEIDAEQLNLDSGINLMKYTKSVKYNAQGEVLENIVKPDDVTLNPGESVNIPVTLTGGKYYIEYGGSNLVNVTIDIESNGLREIKDYNVQVNCASLYMVLPQTSQITIKISNMDVYSVVLDNIKIKTQ